MIPTLGLMRLKNQEKNGSTIGGTSLSTVKRECYPKWRQQSVKGQRALYLSCLKYGNLHPLMLVKPTMPTFPLENTFQTFYKTTTNSFCMLMLLIQSWRWYLMFGLSIFSMTTNFHPILKGKLSFATYFYNFCLLLIIKGYAESSIFDIFQR